MAEKQQSSRVFYLDNIKVFLTFLVIIHHSAQAFLNRGEWIVKDVDYALWLNNLLLVNMTFFMGAFFFISGYFIPKSRDNKSITQFVRTKVKRLLIPVLILLIVIVPIYFYIAYCYNNHISISFWNYYVEIYWKSGIMSYEHGWYLVSLFLYSMIYLLIEKFLNNYHGKLTILKIIVFIGIMSILSFLIRIVFPIDKWIDIFGVIGIEPAHLPQYFLMFTAGILAYKNKWLENLSKKIGLPFSIIGMMLIILCYSKDMVDKKVISVIFEYFAVFESIMAVSIIIGLIWIIKNIHKLSKGIKVLQDNSFGAYVIHNLYVVLLQVFVFGLNINVNVKFILVAGLAIVLSFFTSMLLRRIPLIAKVI
jgi:fucose 4-O-acetylase-like acetyltransferase